MENKINSDLMVCKACGYKIKPKKLKTLCPACGVGKKYFEPFNDNISPLRRKILELHLHPIVVHFSVAISVFLFLAVLISFFTSGKVTNTLYGTSAVMSVTLPFFVAAGLVSGIIDGITRFKKIKRPMILNKIYLSIFFLLISVAVLALVQVFKFDIFYINILLLILCFVSAVCGSLLGKLGGRLTDAILPGK
ncbi:MAG: hypothetical protein FJW68_03740 [Actinobacteria bacterium]|nr:hypothetical protein [Actinomycetota bacterium]